MNLLNCLIVTILYCLGVICKDQGVFISKDETKWNESSCTLAEPKVTCRDDGSCIVENGLEFLTNAEYQDNAFWIGYAKTWISYAYAGCGQLNTEVEYSVPTLGECRRTAGCKTFGIQNSTAGLRCKCASNNASRRLTCGKKCVEADQYPCGGTADINIFSLYTVENVPPSENSQDIHRNCLMFYYNYRPGNDYFWDSCTFINYQALLCSNKYFSEYNPMAELQNENYGKWAKAVEKCVEGGKFPASIQSIKNVNFTNQEKRNHWTGIMKKDSIISLNDMLDNSTNQPRTYAYVEKINQTFYVRFANESDFRKSLCVGDGTSAVPTITTRETQSSFSESTTTPAKSPTSSVTSTNHVITTDIHSTQAPTLDTSTTPTSHTVPKGTAASIDKDEAGSTAGLAAGLSVSLVVLIIVTVIVLVFFKRRGLLTKCYTPKGGKGNQNEDTRTEISFVSTPILESTTNTMNELTSSNHYFVLEKTFNRETKEETEHYAEPDTTDVDHYELSEMSQKDTNDDYDTTDGKKGPAKSGLAKPNYNYNKVTLHQSNEYDHIHQHGRPPKSDRQTENEYDISNNLIDGNPNENFGEDSDTYNHLNKDELKSSGTDNVYGKSETGGDSGYDTSSCLKPRMNVDGNDQQADYAVIKKKW
ncbi:uncharacterized protein LOC128220407 isoform X2 [Mya arenaria]|uniref:uncharacterized protein LOC128220407 isoform X2 n=1 Tax=Mya arenaria TaxID=6604 RepID=UPI0022E1633F|nr:uncharacterized protein LOC128220407 isoform X2 [Mya arenaria]